MPRESAGRIERAARVAAGTITADGVERPASCGLGFTHAQGFVARPPIEDPSELAVDAAPAA